MRAQWLRCRLRVADLSGFGGAAATVASSSTPPNVSARLRNALPRLGRHLRTPPRDGTFQGFLHAPNSAPHARHVGVATERNNFALCYHPARFHWGGTWPASS